MSKYFPVTTREQRVALKAVYDRKPLLNSCLTRMTYRQFRKTAYVNTMMNCVLVQWCGITLGIEPDGYTHS